MTARGYEMDGAVKSLTTRVRRLELKEARNRPASGVTVEDGGGFFGEPGGLTIEQVLALIGAGTAPGAFLTVIGGGKGTVQSLGNLGATETIDLANANYFAGTLNASCTVTFTGWTNLKDCQIAVELTEDGTGGWSPTFSGVTWIGGVTPTHSTTASSVTIYVFFSRDGGTTIYGAQLGSGSAGGFLQVINGGGGTVQAHGSMGATETIDTASGNYHWGTLNANCTVTFTTTVDTAERWFTLELIEDGTGGWTVTWPGSVVWLGGSTPTHTTTAGTTTIYAFFTRNGGTTWIGGQLGASGSASPLTTKGDLYGYSTLDARVPVGANLTVVTADSTATLGIAYKTIETLGHWEPLMDGGSPYAPLDDGTGTDWLYVFVPG